MTWTPPQHDPQRELRDHLPASGWRDAVAAICARHGLGGAPLEPFPTGSDVVWSAGGHVVKLTAPLWADEIEAEARCQRQVAGRLGVATPEPLATGELAGWPYVVMTRVPGVALGEVWPGLEHAERLRLAAELGALVRELHGIEVADQADGWDGFWQRCRATVTERHSEPGVPGELAAQIGPFLESAGELVDEPRVLIHTELLDQHVLVEERGGRYGLCALIDFADGRVGPAEYEFPAPVEFIFKGEPGLLRSFLSAYGLPEHELTPERSERMLAWGLLHRFGRLLRMLRAVEPVRPATLPALARRLYGL